MRPDSWLTNIGTQKEVDPGNKNAFQQEGCSANAATALSFVF
jgi:hypothetical protein